ncbi:hypothetical protein BC832DRAFT_559167 [Gaertneriomyces semiglobifer]|nr:hypothetical protein BC832DRAFT_559167 [Gaertneriomyces semiglobifer]
MDISTGTSSMKARRKPVNYEGQAFGGRKEVQQDHDSAPTPPRPLNNVHFGKSAYQNRISPGPARSPNGSPFRREHPVGAGALPPRPAPASPLKEARSSAVNNFTPPQYGISPSVLLSQRGSGSFSHSLQSISLKGDNHTRKSTVGDAGTEADSSSSTLVNDGLDTDGAVAIENEECYTQRIEDLKDEITRLKKERDEAIAKYKRRAHYAMPTLGDDPTIMAQLRKLTEDADLRQREIRELNESVEMLMARNVALEAQVRRLGAEPVTKTEKRFIETSNPLVTIHDALKEKVERVIAQSIHKVAGLQATTNGIRKNLGLPIKETVVLGATAIAAESGDQPAIPDAADSCGMADPRPIDAEEPVTEVSQKQSAQVETMDLKPHSESDTVVLTEAGRAETALDEGFANEMLAIMNGFGL